MEDGGVVLGVHLASGVCHITDRNLDYLHQVRYFKLMHHFLHYGANAV
jgi:hypothetical protein